MTYTVLDSYQRFNQKNNMIYRPVWNSSLRHLITDRWETQLYQIKKKVSGHELKDYVLGASAGLLVSTFGTGINQPNGGLKSWQRLPINALFKFPGEKPVTNDRPGMTRQIKKVARFLGADLVGIAPLDLRWVYSYHYIEKTGESKPVEIDEQLPYVISMAVEEDYKMIHMAPNALLLAEAARQYSRMAFLVGAVAQFIRLIGYHAIPSINDSALNIPIAIDAGLGQLGRHGMLITPQFGPRQRLCKVFTNLPLEPDRPIDFGVKEFCSVCRKCAQKCPAQAISEGEPTPEAKGISNNPGVMKYPLDAEKCQGYWSKVGTDCGICIRVCPFNKGKGMHHDTIRWFVKNAPWFDKMFLWLDDHLEYGKCLRPECFWDT